MDIYDREHLTEFLVALFGKQANSWHPNEELFNLTYKLVAESGGCSEAMRYVPEPLAPGKAPFKWLKKEVRSKFLKTVQENREQYVICLRGAAYNMALEFKMAAQGV